MKYVFSRRKYLEWCKENGIKPSSWLKDVEGKEVRFEKETDYNGEVVGDFAFPYLASKTWCEKVDDYDLPEKERQDLLDALIDERCEVVGILETIEFLMNLGLSKEQLLKMHFEEEDIEEVIDTLEAMKREGK